DSPAGVSDAQKQ
nr:RecName: Full=Hemocyanin subunit 1 [Necora puber]